MGYRSILRKNRASERKSVVIHFFAGWPKDRNDVIFFNLRYILSELCPKMCEILVFCAVAPPMGRLGQAFGFLVPATTTTIWPGFSSLALTVWAARSVLRRNNNNNKKNLNNYNRDSAFHARTPNNNNNNNNNNNKKNPYNYNRDSALRARTPNKKNPYNYNRDSALRARTPNEQHLSGLLALRASGCAFMV